MNKQNILVLAVVIVAVTLMLVAGRYAARDSGGFSGVPAFGVGASAPDFELKATDGQTVRLADYRGKAVLLNFWATWCSPCKIEMPWFVDLQKQYGPEGLVILGVAMDEGGEDDVRKFAQEVGVNYPILFGNPKVADLYGGVPALPTTIYIGRDGKIVASAAGLVSHSEIEANIKKALATGAQPVASGAAQQAAR